MLKVRPERDDALPFTAKWMRGEKRYQLALAYRVKAFPLVQLPSGVKWDLWYDQPYFMLLASVLSHRKWLGKIPLGNKFAPQMEGLAPVLSPDGKRGWYRFFLKNEGLTHRVQFFPELDSSRSEVEFHWGESHLKAETHGGALALESFPEPAFLFRRFFVLSGSGRKMKLHAFEHQNRMAWEAENLVSSGLPALFPTGIVLETAAPEFAYVGKGSPFAQSRASVVQC